MQELVRLGLEKTAKGASVKQGIEGGFQTASIMKGIVDKAVQASPEASVAWVGVCLALDVSSNDTTLVCTDMVAHTQFLIDSLKSNHRGRH